MNGAQDSLTIIVVADDALVRRGLVSLLQHQTFLLDDVSTTEWEGFAEADVLLWDADPELDADAISQQETPVLALAGSEAAASQLLASGAAGVLSRTASAAQIVAGLRAVAEGLVVLELTLAPTPSVSEVDTPLVSLTPRETEVLALLSEGLANKAIAKQLDISVSTVKFHVNSLLGKFGVKTRTELAVRAVQGQTYL